MGVAERLREIVGDDTRVAIRAYDGSRSGPLDAPAHVVVRSPDAFRRLLSAPGELGLARAYVAGDLDLEGDLFAALELRERIASWRVRPSDLVTAARLAGPKALWPLRPPPEEIRRLRGRRHSKARDMSAIAHHYDLSNDFYRLLLGPSMTYSCAVWDDSTVSLEDAQRTKHELVCRKLGLRPGSRILDIGSGWGSFVLHAAAEHGATAVGITISHAQHELARKRVAEAGLDARVTVRLQDYREVDDGPYDAIASIGMFEHVGMARVREYFRRCFALLGPKGRMVNHAIARPPVPGRHRRSRSRRVNRFIDRYVFPDGELHEVGSVVTAMQAAGFEVRHLESLREHYSRTLRCWIANLESGWETAVSLVGEARARVWRLYLALSAVGFDDNRIQVHQVLGVKTAAGASGLPWRPSFGLRPSPGQSRPGNVGSFRGVL